MVNDTETVTLKKTHTRETGVALVLSGACLWGISGNVAQHLFNTQSVDPGWITSVRMLVSGVLLLLLTSLRDSGSVWKIWMSRSSRRSLLVFGLIGMIGAQYTYFEAVAAGNAATATLLQYLNPVLILIYFSAKKRRWPAGTEQIGIVLALVGVFFIATQGRPSQLSIAPAAIFWGLLSAIGGAVYSTQPSRLLQRWGAAPVVGWGMLIGGTVMCFFYPPWIYTGHISLNTFAAILFVIIIGTLVAFYLYVASLKYLKPMETSLLGCAEPLSAAAVNVIWMHVAFTFFDWVGSALIIGTVFILSLARKENQSNHAITR
ncbi:EamA family transporter [Sporolactobacillus spathodeae]|uniref:EamA family transporter n=1 Tax=Sporolactobacillus spathodeae TaxID=1465502 RepID=UPI00196054F1|nr:EamA family transporter [Sporolactobacillus spathodeae]